jgi:hypothetical protein
MRTSAVIPAIIAALFSVSGCEEKITTPPPRPTPTEVPQAVTLVTQGTHSHLQPYTCVDCTTRDTMLTVPFTTSKEGLLEVIIDWQRTEDTIYAAIAVGTNTCIHNGTYDGDCDFLGMYLASEAPKPLHMVAGGLVPARDYTLYIQNGGPHTEYISYQVFNTHDK